ncbi:hypothetical protein [Nocardioides sp.]|jgi:hypothetical protein|uniref:hypothetical protein n=1 Tax=Nocardioides sp. TaxID=35761 RepID=UPI002F3FD70C
MSDDETRPIEPDAPVPPPITPETDEPQAAAPAYAMPLPVGYPAYGVPPAQPRPRFADQVLGMRAVVAVALACLIIGGLSGFILGHASASDDQRFGRAPGGFFQQRAFPEGPGFGNGSQNQQTPPFGPGQSQGQGQNGR